jgi:flavin reductase (DIM6/NTAB) family NADH-FMN oxidoreductase RutF
MRLDICAPAAGARHTTMATGEIPAAVFRRTLGRFVSGVTVVTAVDPLDGQAHGMTASAFLSVSLDPPIALVSLDHRGAMFEIAARAQRFGVSILQEHQGSLAWHFGGRPDPDVRLEVCVRAEVPVLAESLAYLVMRVTDLHRAGDHSLLLGEIEELGCFDDGAPLAYFGGRFFGLTVRAEEAELWPVGPDPVWM